MKNRNEKPTQSQLLTLVVETKMRLKTVLANKEKCAKLNGKKSANLYYKPLVKDSISAVRTATHFYHSFNS